MKQGQRAVPGGKAEQAGVKLGILAVGAAVVAMILASLGYTLVHRGVFGTPPIPTVQGTVSPAGLPVDDIPCQQGESTSYHVHAHLAIYYHGKPMQLPSAIGIPGGEGLFSTECLYWLHTHSTTPNIVHIESPSRRRFVLGQFLDIWTATNLTATPEGDALVRTIKTSAARDRLTVWLNGRRWTRGYRGVPLGAHTQIALEIGAPVFRPPAFNNWGDL